jgi:ApbE superfamily uncharacterized protein (UPF0280 family)
MYEPRTYRHWVSDRGLVAFSAVVKETDLLIRARRDLTVEALQAIREFRAQLERHIISNPHFQASLEPVAVDMGAPNLIRDMAAAASAAGVGPMAAVAGALAEAVGMELLRFSEDVIVENGGDIFIKSSEERLIGLYAGRSRLTGKVAFAISPEETPLGICTSSGTVGHSLSFGKADAVVAFAPSTALADAAATAIGNRVSTAGDIEKALEFAQGIAGLRGVAIVKDDNLGLHGQIRLADVEQE